jgi:F0F1-type ATP synthase delta subunit
MATGYGLDGPGIESTLMAAHRGEVACEVITAKPLDDVLKTDLEAALKSFLK